MNFIKKMQIIAANILIVLFAYAPLHALVDMQLQETTENLQVNLDKMSEQLAQFKEMSFKNESEEILGEKGEESIAQAHEPFIDLLKSSALTSKDVVAQRAKEAQKTLNRLKKELNLTEKVSEEEIDFRSLLQEESIAYDPALVSESVQSIKAEEKDKDDDDEEEFNNLEEESIVEIDQEMPSESVQDEQNEIEFEASNQTDEEELIEEIDQEMPSESAQDEQDEIFSLTDNTIKNTQDMQVPDMNIDIDVDNEIE